MFDCLGIGIYLSLIQDKDNLSQIKYLFGSLFDFKSFRLVQLLFQPAQVNLHPLLFFIYQGTM